MPNWGRIHRITRELVAALVEELGPEQAARVLEGAATQVRGAGYEPVDTTTQEAVRLPIGRMPAQVVDLKR